MVEKTISSRAPRDTTGSICLKSPPRTITFKPNGFAVACESMGFMSLNSENRTEMSGCHPRGGVNWVAE